MKKYSFYIGIDPGTDTGVCAWSRIEKQIFYIATLKIHDAMDRVRNWHNAYPGEIFIRVEDARKRKWFGEVEKGGLQGVGSIKRDCQIWEDFLKGIGANYEFVAPRNSATKVDAKRFEMITEYRDRTNEHTRDAAMLVFGR